MSKSKKKKAQPTVAPKQDTPEVVSGADCKAGWCRPCWRSGVHGSRNTRRNRTRAAQVRKELATY